MIIGEFNESYPPLMDGVGQVVRNYVHEIAALGDDETYAVVAGDREAPDFDRKAGETHTVRTVMHPLPSVAPYGPVTNSRKFLRHVYSIPFDIVHSHSPFYLGKLAAKVAARRGIPHVTTFHSQFRDDIQGAVHVRWITDLAVRYLIRHYEKADEVWVPSRATADKLREYGYKGEIVVMENGCDMEIPDAEEIEALRALAFDYIGIGRIDRPVLLYIGQHKVEKNLMMVLDALRILNERGCPFLMLFAGIGPDKEAMENYVKRNGVDDCVRFLGRITDRRLVQALYSIGSVFLFPSFYDTSCLVMREAAAFSLPVLFVEGSCTSEGIEDGRNGFLAPNDPDAFASKIAAIVGNPELLASAGKGARDSLYRSWTMAAEEVRARYRMLIERKKAEVTRKGSI